MSLKSRSRDFSLQEAATLLGVSRHALVRELEARRVIYHDGQFGPRPFAAAIEGGHFRLESGSTYVFGTLQRHFHRTRVTVQGLAWIDRELTQELAKAS